MHGPIERGSVTESITCRLTTFNSVDHCKTVTSAKSTSTFSGHINLHLQDTSILRRDCRICIVTSICDLARLI